MFIEWLNGYKYFDSSKDSHILDLKYSQTRVKAVGVSYKSL